MSQQSKGIAIAVVAFAGLIGLVIWGGRIVLLAGGAHELPYPAVTDTVPDPTIFATTVGKPTPGLDLKPLFAATPAMVAHGQQLFETNCAMCHGAAGKGDGAAAVALTPKPRDFTSPAGWTVGYTIADIYQTLTEGVKGSAMPAFDALSPADRFAVAHFVQSVGKFDHHDNVAAEIQQVDARYHLGEGPRGPNKVAVPIVMSHMAAEYHAPPPVGMPPAADRSASAELRRRLVADPVRAAEVLAQVADWRTNVEDLTRVATAGAPGNGFRPAVADLTAAQWKAFHDELVKLTPAPDTAGASTQKP
jgi:mono/diheme cytochrome c family protein